MSNEKLRRIIDSHDKAITETRNTLSRLTRLILMDTDVDAEAFDMLLNRYVKKLNEQRGETNSSVKTNFTSALCSPTLTWKYFERFLKVLNPAKVKVTVDITWRNKQTTSHAVDIEFADHLNDDDDE